MKLPPAVHEALVADTARAMARRTPAVAHAAAQIRAEENFRLLYAVDFSNPSDPTHPSNAAKEATP